MQSYGNSFCSSYGFIFFLYILLNLLPVSQRNMVKLSTVVHNLRKVAIRVDFNDDLQADMVFDLLRCFSCLETLDVLVI